ETDKGPASESSAKKKRRIVAITTEDIQKRRNDVKARTTLLLALPDEHQLRFNKYETAKELWEAILKAFGGNEATKKTKKNQLKMQYGNFKAEGSETLKQTFNRLGVTDFASWQQRIRLYYWGKENGVNILKSIDKGPFQMRMFRETLTEEEEGALHLGPERPRVHSDLSPEEMDQYNANIRATNILLQVLPKDIYTLINYYTNVKDIWDNVKMLLEGEQDNVVDEDMDEQPVQDLALNIDNVFEADDCDAFDSDIDEAPTAQTMFMANLSSSSYDSDILSEVHDHDHYQDDVCEHHEVHEIHDDVQPNYVVDSHDDYTSDSNMILYDQYVKENAVPVVQSNVSSVSNDGYMMILNDMQEHPAQHVFVTTRNNVVDKSLVAELATYKEQVELYERRAKFELTKKEQKIDDQLRIVITDRNIKEENLKKELHSVKIQLTSTINHDKSMVAEVTSLKKNFKQKENKHLEEFLDMKAFKEKLRIKYTNKTSLFKQFTCCANQSLIMMNRTSGHEIIKTNHVPAIVHNSEKTLEIAEITRKKMNDKMKDPKCVQKKVKIEPHDYSKENYLATFTPHKQLTPKQIFWSKDLLKTETEALKEQTIASKPIKALTVKHDEIERKNLLIANDNLITDFLSKDVFYTATDSVLTVSRFSDMHEALNAAQKRIAELKFENFNLQKRFKMMVTMYAIDIKPIPLHIRNNWEVHLDYLKHLKKSVETLREIVEDRRKMPLLEEKRSHCQKDCTAINDKKKLPVNDGSYTNKYKTAKELWAAILKTFDGNKATKKTKKNLLKQQYGNFKAVGSETLEQTFNRLQVIVGQLLSDLNTMSLDDLYNHLKVYESEVQKKTEPHSQNMAFISSAKHSSRNKDGNTACVPTAVTNVPTASASIDEDDMEEMDIKWNMALLSMRAYKLWKKTGKKISIQGSDVARFNKSKGSKAEEQDPKALMAIDGVGWDWSYMANEEDDHALVADEVVPTEFSLMANTSAESKVFDNSLCSKDCLLIASKDLDNLIKSQRSDKNKEGLGYTTVPPPTAQLYLSSKKDLSWTGLPECADDTVTDYSRPSPTVESTSEEDQNRNPSVSDNVASPVTTKPFIKFVKPKDSQSESKTDKNESHKKPPVKYAKQYNKKPNVRGNQRNWNNLKSHQLGPDFVMKKKACFNCGNFNHLAYDCRKTIKKNFTPKPIAHRPYRPSQRPVRTNINDAKPNRTIFNKQTHSYANRPVHRTSAVRSPYRAPWVLTINRNYPPVNRKFSTGSRNFPTANRKFSTASRKFPTGSIKSSTADMGMKGKAVKPFACWFWKPSQNPSNKGPKNNSVSVMFKKYTYIDTQGRLKSVLAWVPKEN
nr:hypothetical protein [Tanacetum cinerariifolium]